MLCTVIDIRGDYALIRYEDTGVVSEVALGLLPQDIVNGTHLLFANYEYEII